MPSSLYPRFYQSSSSRCAIEAVESLVHNARKLSPILKDDLVQLGAHKTDRHGPRRNDQPSRRTVRLARPAGTGRAERDELVPQEPYRRRHDRRSSGHYS